MFAAALLFTSSLAGKYQLWEADEPITINLEGKDYGRRLQQRVDNRRRLATVGSTKQLLTQDQANEALKKTNCSEFVSKRPMSLKANDTCWSYDNNPTPPGCPNSGWVKYDAFHFEKATVGKAGIAVDAHNHVGLVVSNVTFHIKKTQFTAQEFGLFTVPCTGFLEGVITGAANAVEAVVNMSAMGVPIIGEASATPVDGVVVDLKHVITGLCGFLEKVIESLIDVLGSLLNMLLQDDLPPIISDLLEEIMKVALGDGSSTPSMNAIEGWSKVV